MTKIDEYKEKKIDEAFHEEDRVHDELDAKLKRIEMREKNGGSKVSNEEILALFKDLGPAREKTKKTIEKYGNKKS